MRSGPDLDQRRDMAPDAAQQGGQAGEQFLHLERLGQVIVGARIDALDPLQPGAAGGQHQDRHDAGLLPQAPHHGQAVELRQAEIEHNGIVILGRGAKPALLAVPGDVHHIAGLGQGARDIPGDGRLILDEKNPHQRLLIWRIWLRRASTTTSW